MIPNEIELSRQMNISRNTLRQAINKLVHEGLLIRKRGIGTYVAMGKFSSEATKG
jgi:GntR family transcriptional regulator